MQSIPQPWQLLLRILAGPVWAESLQTYWFVALESCCSNVRRSIWRGRVCQ